MQAADQTGSRVDLAFAVSAAWIPGVKHLKEAVEAVSARIRTIKIFAVE
jgi:hypothetical protein